MHDSVGIVGTGRVAQALGALLRSSGVPVEVVAGRSPEPARRAAAFMGVPETLTIPQVPGRTRCVVIAVVDDAVAQVAEQLAAAGMRAGVVLHTSGAAGTGALRALREAGNAVGVLHPLQTVPTPEQGVPALQGATFAYAGDAEACALAADWIGRMGGKPLRIREDKWQQYHAASVMACNYHVTLVDAALELMEGAGVSGKEALEALAPLMRATTENVLALGPEKALTGPVRRGDAGTVRRHLESLRDARPETRALYTAAGVRTIVLAGRAGLDAQAAASLKEALEEAVSG